MAFVLWLFEVGYLLQHLATFFQIWKMYRKSNSELISIETNLLFLIGALSRLVWMWDSMLKGFWLAYVEIFLGFASLICVIYLHQKYKESIFSRHDIITLPIYYRLWVLIPVVVLLSVFFHPGSKDYLNSQTFVSMSMFAEAIGLLPQLYLIRASKDSGDLSGLYIVFLGFARFFRLLFWLKMYYDGIQFISLIIADLVHCACLFNFIYNAISNWSGKMLPTSLSGKEDSSKKMF